MRSKAKGFMMTIFCIPGYYRTGLIAYASVSENSLVGFFNFYILLKNYYPQHFEPIKITGKIRHQYRTSPTDFADTSIITTLPAIMLLGAGIKPIMNLVRK
jgi:hypothetical protein